MPLFDVFIVRVGSIVVEAPTAQESLEKFRNIPLREIEERASLTGWDADDAVLIED